MCVDTDRDAKRSGQAKVCQLDAAHVVNEQILWLEVTVQHTPCMAEQYALTDLEHVALQRE